MLDEPVAVWDLLPTLADAPPGLDGVSFLPALTGRRQPSHPYLYWRKNAGGEAVRFGNWKGVRLKGGSPIELYDLGADAGESTDIAATHPALVRQAERLLADAVASG
ncbi:hypothetical protein [Streptomyces sp. NPDC060035]|uniref:hypothetical protein n=1 Tax=Streptomyces sp. NPDC060035 TaxID=3347044 RepID=UPI0036BE1BE5